MRLIQEAQFSDLIIFAGGGLLKGGGSPTRKLNDEYREDLAGVIQLVEAEREVAARRQECTIEEVENFRLEHDGNLFRVSIFPGLDGEQIALRPINPQRKTLKELNIPSGTAQKLMALKSGLVLISGSMGMGKTSTAAGFVGDHLATHPGTAITIEDPPEVRLHGWHGDHSQCFQSEVHHKQFGNALVKILRQNPNIIFLGELREEHAIIEALNVSITGHLIVATIHAGSVVNTLTRVVERVSSQFKKSTAQELLAEALSAVVYQKLMYTSQRTLPQLSTLWVANSPHESKARSLIREGQYGGIRDLMKQQSRGGRVR